VVRRVAALPEASASLIYVDWTHRVPKGVTDVRKDGTRISAKVAMPESEDGYVGCECPSCSRFFKVMISEFKALPDSPINCPYCGHSADTGDFMTEQQLSRVTAGAEAVAEQFVHAQLDDIFGRAFRSSKHVSYTRGSMPPKRALPTYVEEAVLRTIECEKCGNHQAVYGASAFCYVCGPRDTATTVIEELASQRRALALGDQLSVEQREDARAHGVFDGLAGDAIESVVTEFEVYAREEFSERVANGSAVAQAAGGRGIFQRLEDADILFAQHAGFALSSLIPADVWSRLLRAFQQRHVLTHKGGHIDQQYLDRVPGSSLAVGQRLVVSRAEADQALNDLESLIVAIEAKA
jgi:hypothetical protein